MSVVERIIREYKPDNIAARVKLAGQRSYTVETSKNRLQFDISHRIAKTWFGTRCADGPHEPNMADTFESAVSRGEVVFDVGSHLGFYSVLASACNAGEIHAFDLDQHRLRITGSHPTDVPPSLVCAAIASESGRCVGYSPRQSGRRSTTQATRAKRGEQSLATISLDDYCTSNDVSPDVVKMDIEGGEVDALRGFEHTLATSPPEHVLVEIHRELLRDRGEDPDWVEEFLAEHGYRINTIPGENERIHAVLSS
ncbi:FkbM family methyltransferase [Halobacterium hubeiense]|uniref:FkbM family methyltransferase n=1 Tax=Halobacterium hubeiense TaxID=1407499 RepID=UPI003C77EBF4